MPRMPWQHVPPTVETLRHPPREYGILPFWFLNGELDPDEMRWQLREKEMPGIILHGRFGLEVPYLGPEFRQRVRLAVGQSPRRPTNRHQGHRRSARSHQARGRFRRQAH